MEQPYSNREIDQLIHGIKQHIDDAVVKQLGRIEDQVKTTNGRVSSLERWRTGIAYVVTIVTAVVIPLLVYANQLQIDNIKLLIK